MIRAIWLLMTVACIFFCPLFSLQAKTEINVGVYQNKPNSFITEKGEVKGFFVDILEAVAKKEDWQITYHPDTWAQCLKRLQSGEIDLLGVIAYSPERAKAFDYTYESIQSEWAQVYTHRKGGLETVLDFKFKKIAVLQGDIHFINLREMMQSFGFSTRFIEAFEYDTVLGLVESGRCQAGVVSHFYGLEHENDFDVYKSPVIFSPQKLYFAVPRGRHRNLLDALDYHVRRMKRDNGSAYYQAIDKWFVHGDGGVLPSWLLWVMAGSGTLLLIFFTTSLILRNRIKVRTRELTEKNVELMRMIEQRKKIEKERLKLETQLQRAQKMEAIGTLAGGVAHDLNNILSGLVSYPELLLMELPADSPLRKPIRTIKKSGENAARIVNDMLTLARRGVAVTDVVNLNRIISDYLNSPEFEKLKFDSPGVEVETCLEKDLLNNIGSPIHLTKTVMNLVSNAVEAMPQGGRIKIETRNSYIDHPVRGYDTIDEGDYVVLRVADNGIGISSDDINRIFEPFYTKKVMGRSGTGLGMAVVWGTIKDHRGYIDVSSAQNEGTVFTIYLPVTRQQLPADMVQPSLDKYRGNGESILLVDDIADQREIAGGMLKKLGYRVTTVAGGEEAVRLLEQAAFDLLVLDMIMDPGMDGLDTYKKALAIHPGQKAIIASGFSETERVKEAQKLGAGAYVKKPYTMEKLGSAVRKELKGI